MKQLLARLERWLATHRKRYLDGLRPGANPKELDSMQAQLDLSVPPALIELLAWRNGQGHEFIGKFEADWLLMGTDGIPDAYRQLLAGAIGNGKGNGFRQGWIPFLDDDEGDYLCLDTTQPKAPVRAFWLGNQEHPIIAPSLTVWMRDFVTALEAGEYHEEPERGTLLRRTNAND